LRIAVVNSIRAIGGGEKWLVRQASTWREQGMEPLIVCQPDSGLRKLCEAAGLPAHPLRMRHDVDLRAALALSRIFRSHSADVVLCCNERAFRLAAPATRLAASPALLYRNGLTATFKNRGINRFLFRWVSRMVVNTEALREEMAAFGWMRPEQLQVINNGIVPQLYDPDPAARERLRAEQRTPPDRAVAAVVARVTEDKGQVETTQAVAELCRDGADLDLWIVGEGSLQPRLEAQARELGIAERVRFLGFRTDVAAVYQAIDILVQASYREGLGNALLEAMASSRPIVASAVGGTPDVVVPGETGELVPAYDAGAIRDALAPLVASPELRRQYGENGRRRVEQHFRLEGETAAWCRLFADVARSSEARRTAVSPREGAA
jgi:glycosyltransferase involved in cell wall biosynthesis